ncbi:MAG TPA: response regulator transcription factor [Anaerolineae bacterium]|nr:response regulator transcription factor [Anaerolineae bacterium]
MPTRLIVLSPAMLHREAWRALLSAQPDLVVCGLVADVTNLTALLPPGQPTTLLVDLPAPQLDVARQVKSLAPEAGVLFLVQSYELTEIVPLLQAGATGFVSRNDSVGDLVRAIAAAGRGELVLPTSIAAGALTALARGESVGLSPSEALSERELEVLRLLGQGLTNKDIAQTLILSVRTVEAHLRNIYGKLGVHSRTEAALWAVRHGYGAEE